MWYKFIDYLVGIILIGLLLFLSVCFVNKLKQAYPNTVLKISGQIDYIDINKMNFLLSDSLNQNLWKINVLEVKNQINQEPWISSIFVEKIWPNTLKLNITSQIPVARWNQQFWITASGLVLSSTKEQSVHLNKLSLPNFIGKEQEKDLILSTYLLLLDQLAPIGLFVASINYVEEQGINVLLTNNLLLKLGTFDLSGRISRFIIAYKKKLHTMMVDLDYVDLRYNNGVAVCWNVNSKEVSTM